MKKVLILFLTWFLAFNLFAVLVNNRITLKGDSAYIWQNPDTYNQAQTWNPIPLHAQWDSAFYLYIAEHGYNHQKDGLSNIVFFPLYPLAVKLAAPLFAWNYPLAGWVLSSMFFFLALYFLWKLTKEFHQNIPSAAPIIFLSIFPTVFFLNVVYTESLFLLLSILSLYFARREHFPLAALFGFLAALTRPVGLLLFIPLVIEFFRAHKKGFADLLAVCAVPLAPVFFFLYHLWRFGDFFLFFKAEQNWGRAFALNEDHLTVVSRAGSVHLGLDIFFVVLAIVCAIIAMKKIRLSYGLYMIAGLALALGTGTLLSIGRFVLVLFPIYLVFGLVKNPYGRVAIALPSVLLAALYTMLFVNGYWAG